MKNPKPIEKHWKCLKIFTVYISKKSPNKLEAIFISFLTEKSKMFNQWLTAIRLFVAHVNWRVEHYILLPAQMPRTAAIECCRPTTALWSHCRSVMLQ